MRGRRLWEFCDVGPGHRHRKRDPVGPEGVADAGEDIGKGRMGLGIPSGPSRGQRASPVQEVCHQDQPTEELLPGRGGAGNGPVRPRARGRDTQMSAHLLKGGLPLPTAQVLGEDRGWRPVGVRTEQRLGPLATHPWLPEGLPLLMDRAYEGDETRQPARDLGFRPVVPPHPHRKEPWIYDKELYKQRNEVERLFRRLKGYRRVFTRYDKLDVMYGAFVLLALDSIASSLRRYCGSKAALSRLLAMPNQVVFSCFRTCRAAMHRRIARLGGA